MYLELDNSTVEELELKVGFIEKISGKTTLINAKEIESVLEELLYKIHKLEEEAEDLQETRNELWKIEQQRNVASWNMERI